MHLRRRRLQILALTDDHKAQQTCRQTRHDVFGLISHSSREPDGVRYGKPRETVDTRAEIDQLRIRAGGEFGDLRFRVMIARTKSVSLVKDRKASSVSYS